MKGNITKLIFGKSERKYSLFRHSEDGLLCKFVDNDYIGSEATHRVAYTEAPGRMPHAGIYNGVICFRVECVPNE